jgi:hypothetical protein
MIEFLDLRKKVEQVNHGSDNRFAQNVQLNCPIVEKNIPSSKINIRCLIFKTDIYISINTIK